MFEIPLLLLVLVLALVLIVAPSRRRPGDQRMCASCGAAHPPFAKFCRRCGKQL